MSSTNAYSFLFDLIEKNVECVRWFFKCKTQLRGSTVNASKNCAIGYKLLWRDISVVWSETWAECRCCYSRSSQASSLDLVWRRMSCQSETSCKRTTKTSSIVSERLLHTSLSLCRRQTWQSPRWPSLWCESRWSISRNPSCLSESPSWSRNQPSPNRASSPSSTRWPTRSGCALSSPTSELAWCSSWWVCQWMLVFICVLVVRQ